MSLLQDEALRSQYVRHKSRPLLHIQNHDEGNNEGQDGVGFNHGREVLPFMTSSGRLAKSELPAVATRP